jgi:hypothetical protein
LASKWRKRIEHSQPSDALCYAGFHAACVLRFGAALLILLGLYRRWGGLKRRAPATRSGAITRAQDKRSLERQHVRDSGPTATGDAMKGRSLIYGIFRDALSDHVGTVIEPDGRPTYSALSAIRAEGLDSFVRRLVSSKHPGATHEQFETIVRLTSIFLGAAAWMEGVETSETGQAISLLVHRGEVQ